MKPRVLPSLSSGKDSAWTPHVFRQRDEVELVGPPRTINETFSPVAMHGVRRELAQAQADAAELPPWQVRLPWPCPSQNYEALMKSLVAKAVSAGVTAFMIGDLFLEGVRAYRVRQFVGTGPLADGDGLADG